MMAVLPRDWLYRCLTRNLHQRLPPGTATTIEVNTVAAANCEAQAGTTYITCKELATTTDLSGTPLGGSPS